MGPILRFEKLHVSFRGNLILYVIFLIFLSVAPIVQAQNVVDPGPRGRPVGAGGHIANLSSDQLRFFNDAAAHFINPEAVVNGLGPTFNGDSCGTYHSQPAIGGTSPSTAAFPFVGPNPQVALAAANHGPNPPQTVPFFVTADGPVREARFKFVVDPDGSIDRNEPDGGVHDLFTIQGRLDAPGCVLAQEDFTKAQNQNNLSLRIPTPVFGGGLIEMIDDATILTNMQANLGHKRQLGIHGTPNRSGNDGTITRFGWKAQNKSLIMFSHEAYSVEIGETNQMFPQKRGVRWESAACNLHIQCPAGGFDELYGERRYGVSAERRRCLRYVHEVSRPANTFTDRPRRGNLERKWQPELYQCRMRVVPYSVNDHRKFLFHGKRARTESCASQPILGPAAPPHGLGAKGRHLARKRGSRPVPHRAPLGRGPARVFLHDGRSSDLLQTIQQHASQGSEANGVIRRFNGLTDSEKQDLINFLRSL